MNVICSRLFCVSYELKKYLECFDFFLKTIKITTEMMANIIITTKPISLSLKTWSSSDRNLFRKVLYPPNSSYKTSGHLYISLNTSLGLIGMFSDKLM